MSVSADGFNASALWEELYTGLQDKEKAAAAIKQVNAILVVTLKNKEGKEVSWLLDLKKEGKLTKVDGSPPKGDVQLLLKDVDFVKLANGKANGQKLFMNGKLKIKGNMMKATALESVFKQLDTRPKAKL
ncbi:Oleate-induced peroxisomal protein POX18 [Spathaspora sp. JA1]|nr:Oleate-induced peroxisomal protein POX18 [Spathaspora sp. JA1]